MDRLLESLGHLIPDMPSTFRIKLYIVGIGCLFAGMMTMAVPCLAIRGVGIAACGVALLGLGVFDGIRAGRLREEQVAADRIRLEREKVRLQEESVRLEREAKWEVERKLRQQNCDGHAWKLDQQALNVDVWAWVCMKCGAYTSKDPEP